MMIAVVVPGELIGGPERRVVRIVDWSPAWPGRFVRERARIVAALGERAERVEHVGSTAVPGLAAKPIVDLQVSVVDIEDEGAYVADLVGAGYVLRVREHAHRMLRTRERDVHVNVCDVGGDWERRHLLFRDWLRHDAEDRHAYEALKRRLATRDWPDMNAYAEAKSAFIAAATARAERWAAGWWGPPRGWGG